MKFAVIIFLNLAVLNFSAFGYQVYFSPKTNLDEVVVQEISKAKKTIDISIYTFRSNIIVDALVLKLQENPQLKLRLLMRKVAEDAMIPFLDPLEAALTKLGLSANNIRHVNVTNHHKFMIVDGRTLLNTSGNFNDSELAQSYDENLFVCSRSCPDLVSAFQAEFEYLYDHSNFLRLDEIRPMSTDLVAPAGRKIVKSALFSSENFEPSQRGDRLTFRIKKDLDLGWVERHLIKHIESAQTSVKVATGHLRSYTLAETLMKASKKGIKVELILDSQEYLSPTFQAIEDQEKQDCVLAGKKLEDCVETGFHFGRWLSEQGVQVYFKYYMIFWDFMDAPQMHHKYLIIDDKLVLTGSYNWSKNAEFKTFENKAIIDHAPTVRRYVNNFAEIKSYGQGELEALQQKWAQATEKITMVFPPMALTVPQIDGLRQLLSEKCKDLFKRPNEVEALSAAEAVEPEADTSMGLPEEKNHDCLVTQE